jgi:hypothetical protein
VDTNARTVRGRNRKRTARKPKRKDPAFGRKDAATSPGSTNRWGRVMQAPWNHKSTFLPYTGEAIDFMLEDRSQPMHGTFANGMFHSRWADYDVDRVHSWREAHGEPPALQADLSKMVTTGTWIARLNRRLRDLVWHRHVAPQTH